MSQIYSSESDALNAFGNKTQVYISFLCPYTYNQKVCGSWCPLFEKSQIGTTVKVNLRCGNKNQEIS